MQLSMVPSGRIGTYLETRRLLIIPVGATEQHGAAGLLGTDAICAEAVATRVGAALRAPVAPVIAVGMSQFHLSFPGTLTLTPATLQAVIIDLVRSAAAQGFRRIYVLNGHGGNIAPVIAAFQQVHAEAALRREADIDLRLRLRNWWQGQRTGDLVQRLYGDREGFHVTASEIAMVRHLHPEQALAFAPGAGFHGAGDETDHWTDQYDSPADFRRRYPDGLVGSDPSLSTPEDGAMILRAAVEDVIDDVRAFEAAS